MLGVVSTVCTYLKFMRGGGRGTLGISEWGCATWNPQPILELVQLNFFYPILE